MVTRSKLFLTLLGLSFIPLVLLAFINYRNGLQIAEAALRREQEIRAAAIKDPIHQLLKETAAGLDSAAVAASHEQLLAQARLNGWVGFIAALVFATLWAWFLTHQWERQARGLERVTEGVEAIAKGKLDHRIDLKSRDDLRPLADNLGLMTTQLRDQIAREAETRQFQSFVRLSAMLTHDLKNAIEALSLTVANMERHFDNKEFRADALKSLTGATDNLRALVARLSNPVSTLSGEHKRPQPVDLVPMLRRVISMIAEPAAGRHEIKVDRPEKLFALVDIARIEKVFENLIINALEAMNKEPGRLSIAAGTTEEGKPFFSVSDTGEGMTDRFMEEKLFHPFATTKRRGVGLGLYTCREVVVANSGSITVDSKEGAGTTFRVVLPSGIIDKPGADGPHKQSHS
ncbi:MAG TPA: ATP-binding protein [Pyrinomonadaceae bacterium]|nr:ATP-binding protein [Pyrinomonadaceae bacterium]